MKRFTETNKWADPWFRKLAPKHKLLWSYICDTCDQAGVLEVDWELASFQIGQTLTAGDMDKFGDRVVMLESGKWHIVQFVQFQYGKLSESCKPHAPVFAALERHGLPVEGIHQNASFRCLVDDSQRRRIIKRDGLVCAYTGEELTDETAAIDHIFPRAKGGLNEDENLVVAGREVNLRKRDRHVLEFCAAENIDVDLVLETLSKRTGKPMEAFRVSIEGYLGSLKDKTRKGIGKRKEGVQREGFDEFWTAYPRKDAKADAVKAWEKVEVELPVILTAIERQKTSADWTKQNGQFIPLPASWLNGKRWEDGGTRIQAPGCNGARDESRLGPTPVDAAAAEFFANLKE